MYIPQLPPSLQKKIQFCSAVFFVVIFLDQFSKYLVTTYKLLPVFFNNTIAFSLPIAWYLPWLFLLVILIYVLLTNKARYFTIEKLDNLLSKHLLAVALPLIAGGGISNIIDRIFHNGSVVDFIDLRYWPVFNLADSAIVIGVFLIIYHLYQKKGA